MKNIHGRCSCGNIEFTIPDDLLYSAYCHCSECRRATGSSFAVFGGLPLKALKILKGDDFLGHYEKNEDSVGSFCENCGSSLFGSRPKTGLTNVLLGALDEPPSLAPQVHVCTASKAVWDIIADDLPQYEGEITD